jgi:hypothetical protein
MRLALGDRARLLHAALLDLAAQALAVLGLRRARWSRHQHVAVGQHVQPARVVEVARRRRHGQPGRRRGALAGRQRTAGAMFRVGSRCSWRRQMPVGAVPWSTLSVATSLQPLQAASSAQGEHREQ